MAITYTSRKGFTYTLCKGTTKTGKLRYYFSREPKGEVVEQLPEGYKITESVNGIVSLTKDVPSKIRADEWVAVQQVLKRHPHATKYQLHLRPDRIQVYEAMGPSIDELVEDFGKSWLLVPDFDSARAQRLREEDERCTQYWTVMQFILVDEVTRRYQAERWNYRGSIDGWMGVDRLDTISALAERLIPKLGTDAFFELYR